ncbi:MAG: glycosyltransferase family 4 protein [Candidatus Moraniibacteriota bacterium]|nr:MAG: glycosyltransferase family 4 protein [Candidatus Moranbacteria bacterium]
MKILLPFEIKDIGGTATFAAKFRDRISVHGHTLLNQFQSDFDVLLIIADCPLWIPLYAKLIGKKVVQRLDGVYHPATPAGRLYPLYNLKMWIIHRFLADTVIYQSTFSQRSCELFIGKTGAKHTTVIYNGVDVEKIQARNPFSSSPPTKLVTFAKFRRRDQIEPIVESVKHLDPEAFLLDIYGSYTENLRSLFEGLPDNIHFMGKRKNDEMLGLLSGYDIFLFSDQSACPNSVLEAMAAGLPTVAFERGSIPELIESGYNGKTVAVQNDSDPYRDAYPFSGYQYRMFADAIHDVTTDLLTLSENSHKRAKSTYNLDNMIRSYETLLTDNH